MTWALALLAAALLALDCAQTLVIFRTGRRELNPVIRWAHARFGEPGIYAYFAAWIAACAGIAADGYEWVPYALAALIVLQAVVVTRNHRRGIRP